MNKYAITFTFLVVLGGCSEDKFGERLVDPGVQAEFHIQNSSNFQISSTCLSESECVDFLIEPGERSLVYNRIEIGIVVPQPEELVPEYLIKINTGNNQTDSLRVQPDEWAVEVEESDYRLYVYTLLDQNITISE